MYLVVNGDNVGEQLSDIIVNDDVQGFEQTSNKFNQARQAIDEMVQQAGGRVVVSNADEAVYELPESDYSQLADQIMQSYKEAAGTSVTIGSGPSLSQAYKALNDGKEAGKDQYMPYSDNDQQENDEDVDFQGDTGEEQAPDMQEEYLDSNIDDSEDSEQLVPDNTTEDEMQEDVDGIDQDSNTDQDPEFGQDFDDDQTQDTENADFEESEFQDDDSDFTDIDEEGEHEDIHSLLASHMADDEDMEYSDEQSEDDIPFLQDHEIGGDEDSSPEMMEDDQEMGDEMAQDPMQDETPQDDAPQTDDELKQRIMMSLQQFKENKGAIEQAKQTDPEAYQSMISMLQAMIAMAKQLGVSVDEQPDMQDDQMVQPAPQGQPVPKM